MSDELEKVQKWRAYKHWIFDENDNHVFHPESTDFSSNEAELIVNEVNKALRRQAREALELSELKILLAYAGHTYFCESTADSDKCVCGYLRAYEHFTKLVEKLK